MFEWSNREFSFDFNKSEACCVIAANGAFSAIAKQIATKYVVIVYPMDLVSANIVYRF